MRPLAIGIAAAFHLLLLSGRAAAETPDKIVVVTEELPPYSYTENGKLTGVSTEVVQAVLNEVKIEGSFVSMPWARALRMAESKPNVLIYTIGMTEDRKPHFKWVGEIATGNVILYCLKARPIKLASLDDAKKYKIGTIYNDFRLEYLRRHGFAEGQNLNSTTSHELNYAKLKGGRIDLWPMDSSVMTYIVRKAGDDPDKTLMPAMELTNLEAQLRSEMAFGEGTSDELVALFRKGLQTIKDNGVYDAIQKKWKP